jgi:hypothetical protein
MTSIHGSNCGTVARTGAPAAGAGISLTGKGELPGVPVGNGGPFSKKMTSIF